MKTQQLKTELGEFIAVELPKSDTLAYQLVEATRTKIQYWTVDSECKQITLPKGKYEILGFAGQEKVARQVVFGIEDRYRSYTDFFRTYNTAIDCLSSLLQSEGVFTENPYPNPNKPQPPCRDCADEDGECHSRNGAYCDHSDAIKQYEEAQSKLWTGKILILKKINHEYTT